MSKDPAAAARPLSRTAGDGSAAPPARLAHLGLGNFFRAHQAWYTQHAPDAQDWGIAAFTGRSPQLAETLAAQDGLYTLVTRSGTGDSCEVLGSVARAYPGGDHRSWRAVLRAPETSGLTLTVTEAAYRRGPDGGLDLSDAELVAEIEALRRDHTAPVRSVPGRLVAGFAARRRDDAGPIAVIPCDNLPDNGSAVARVITGMAELVDPGLAAWIDESVSFVTTMVDRITPRTTASDLSAVVAATGRVDGCPVITEPFSEWVLAGNFPAGRPRWEDAGATFTTDVTPFEQRKLWLLNGAHSLLAYAGSLRGHATVAQAMADHTCLTWVDEWWTEACRHVRLPAVDVADYTAALMDRFANVAIRHRLDQIAADGSQKLPVRVVPVLARERAGGRMPLGASRIIAAWVLHLRGMGSPVSDANASRVTALAGGPLADAVRRVLDHLDPALGADVTLGSVVLAQAEELTHQ